MAAIGGRVTAVSTRRVKEIETDKRTKERRVVGTHSVLRIVLESDDCDIPAMEQAFGEMIGQAVEASVTLDQEKLLA